MSFEEHGLPKIREALRDGAHLISALGDMLAEDERPAGKLRQALEIAGIKTKRIGTGPKIYAYLEEESSNFSELIGDSSRRHQYKRAVVLAFTKHVAVGNKMTLKFHPKTEYDEIAEANPLANGAFLVEEQYRIPTIPVDISPEIMEELHAKILSWSEEHGVDRDLLLWKQHKNTQFDSNRLDLETFIRKFYAAQPENIRYDVNLPGFVVRHLLNKNG